MVDTAPTARCSACANTLRPAARFCDQCGAAVSAPSFVEHKQVTVLFADVVGSMRLASRLDPERLRAIMNELFNNGAAVVQRYQGTVDKFTGDGLMALFGAPVALEDHALRACVAALEIQAAAERLADELLRTDGIELQVRVGLNSGDVIAGDIGAGPGRYTAVGHPVGLAQRMEAAAPPGGVLCSVATAHLVESSASLGPVQEIIAKGFDVPLFGRRLLSLDSERIVPGRSDGRLFGRAAEVATLTSVFESGSSAVIGIIGSPGVGKSRLAREFVSGAIGADVVTARCDAHTTGVAFRALSRLLRALFGVVDLDPAVARDRTARELGWITLRSVEAQTLFDAMGIADSDLQPSQLSVDGRRHILLSIIRQVLGTRSRRTVLVIEDAQWIDAPSDEVLTQLTGSLDETSGTILLVTCRPDFGGDLRRTFDHRIALEPLPPEATRRFVRHILGSAVPREVSERITQAAGGNPLFVEEIVRDLADRGLLEGTRGNYRLVGDTSEIAVPPTVIAVLTARIDRLSTEAKSVLNAAAVIGSHFDLDTLRALVSGDVTGPLDSLVAAELIDQTEFVPAQRYCFHHQLVRKVAYESQLSANRATTHVALAAAIRSAPDFSDENAGLVAAHLESAGEMAESCQWHMRAAEWLRYRDLPAARVQWKAARDIADRIDDRSGDGLAMRITPRALLTSTTLYVSADTDSDHVYEELRTLAVQSGQLEPLALGIAGRMFSLTVNQHNAPPAVALADELTRLRPQLRPDTPRDGILINSLAFTHFANCDIDSATTELDELIRTPEVPSEELIPARALRGFLDVLRGNNRGGRLELSQAVRDSRLLHPVAHASILIYPTFLAALGILSHRDLLDEADTALHRTTELADEFAVILGHWLYGTILLRAQPDSRVEATKALERAYAGVKEKQVCGAGLATIVTDLAMLQARNGGLGPAIERLRTCFDTFITGLPAFAVFPAEALVDLLLRRGEPDDVAEAATVVARYRPGVPALDLWSLKAQALLARARGDAERFKIEADAYLAACRALGATGRIAPARRLATKAA